MNLAELKEAYKARKLALDSAKKEEEKYKALLKDAMLEAGESDYTDEAGYRFERIVQERKSMDEEKLLAELHKVMFKECKALEPVSMALAKGYKSATPLQRLEIIRELDTELAEVYSVEIPVITAWVRDDNYVHSTKEIFLGEPSLEGFLHQFRHHLQNKAREPQYKYLLVENDPKADYRIPYKDCVYRMYGEDDARAWARMVIELAS